MPLNIDMAELDAALEEFGARIPQVVDRGFTINELQEAKGMTRATCGRFIQHMTKLGKVRAIGYRPGPGGAKVYEMVTPVAQN
jgi:DNA-binding IclR family transcriptional regulator